MTTSATPRLTERNAFFNGQRLFAADLQSVETLNREMRWLHNRSLHQPGLASGYAVAGAAGTSVISVSAGYAIDVLGREIVLTEDVVVQVPPVADDGTGNPVVFDLTVSYPETLIEAQRREEVCADGITGAIRLREVPVFRWLRANDPAAEQLRRHAEDGLALRLARARVINCMLYEPISIAQRTNAKPSVTPYMFAATEPPAWKADRVGPLGLVLTPRGGRINTSRGKFRTVPGYFASVIRPDASEPIGTGSTRVVVEGFVNVIDPKVDSFELMMFIPALLFPADGETSADQVFRMLRDRANADTLKWRIEWVGVEA